MHSYLKAVGFSEISGKKELDSILNNVINEYDEKIVAAGRAGHSFIELIKRYGDDFGIVVCVENMMKIMSSKWNIISHIFSAQGLLCRKK